MIYYLTHYDRDTFPFLIQYLREKGYEVEYTHTPTDRGETVNALRGAWSVVRKAGRGDTIITYMCSAGMLCWWISMLTGKRVRVISCNLTLKNDGSLRTRVLTWLYRVAVRSKRYTQLVTSKQYGATMQNLLHATRPFPLLRDYNQYPGYARPFKDYGKRIFCGGNSLRDWKRCLHVAQLMPDWKFIFVGYQPSPEDKVPRNVKTFRAVPFAHFMKIMSEATVVLNIVKYNCPAGLIVMMEATWEGRLVATNRNDVTEEYVSAERGIIGDSDEDIASCIQKLYLDQEEMASRVSRMQEFLKEECSKQRYCETFGELVLQKH